MLATLGAIDWDTLGDRPAGSDDLFSSIDDIGLGRCGGLCRRRPVIWLLLSIAILYPIFQAMVLRWWVSGLRFGDVAVTSRLRTAQVYGVYARFLGYALLFTLVCGVVMVAMLCAGHRSCSRKEDHSTLSEIIATVALVGAYVVAALGYSTIYQATVRLGLWRCVVGIARHRGRRRARACLRRRRAELADRRRPRRRAERGRDVTIRDLGA